MPKNGGSILRREPVLVVTGTAAAIVTAIQALIPYMTTFGIPEKVVTVLTTLLGLVGAGAVARSKVISPATWDRLTARPFPTADDQPGPAI